MKKGEESSIVSALECAEYLSGMRCFDGKHDGRCGPRAVNDDRREGRKRDTEREGWK